MSASTKGRSASFDLQSLAALFLDLIPSVIHEYCNVSTFSQSGGMAGATKFCAHRRTFSAYVVNVNMAGEIKTVEDKSAVFITVGAIDRTIIR